jgi:hypothetical protein
MMIKSLLSRIEEENTHTGNLGSNSNLMKAKDDFSTFSEDYVNLLEDQNQGSRKQKKSFITFKMQGGEKSPGNFSSIHDDQGSIGKIEKSRMNLILTSNHDVEMIISNKQADTVPKDEDLNLGEL